MNSDVKVLFIIDELPIGGAERVFIDLLYLLKGKLLYDACLITGGGELESELPSFITTHKLNRLNKYSLLTAFKAYRIFKNYDILHVHMRHNFRYVQLIKILARLNKKVILHDHFGGIALYKGKPFKFWKYLLPDTYIGVSNELREWALRFWNLEYDTCYTLINLPKIILSNNAQKVNAFENRNGIVILGNIKKVKNQELGIHLANILKKNITLIGRNQDNNYFLFLKNMKKEIICSFNENISDPEQYLPNFEIGLCTSLSESGPLVILEYLLSGIPFLSYKTGGISTIVSNYFPEYFIDNHDSIQWSQRIQFILTKHFQIDRYKVKEMLNTHFSDEVYINKLLSIYERT